MTPKEKAKELYSKYEFVYIQNYTSKHEVVQCCLIAVDEILKASPIELIGSSGKFRYMEGYWEGVKQELESF